MQKLPSFLRRWSSCISEAQKENVMSIVIRLDTNALIYLIESDPNFKSDLAASVIANVCRKYINAIPGDTKQMFESMAAKERDAMLETFLQSANAWSANYVLSGAKAESIKKLVQSQVEKSYNELVNKEIIAAMLRINNEIAERVKVYVDDLVWKEVRKQVSERVKATLSAVGD